MELDVVAESADGRHLLVGEVKWRVASGKLRSISKALSEKIERLPVADRYSSVVPCVFAGGCNAPPAGAEHLITAAALLPSLT